MQIHSNEPEMTKGNDKSNDPNQDKKVDNLGKKSTIATDQRVTSVFYMVASLAAGGLLGVLGCTLYQQQIDVQEKSTSTETYGAVYTRWGHEQCPESQTTLVYAGYIGGAHYTHQGGAADYLCLTRNPTQYTHPSIYTGGHGYLYGGEYEFGGSNTKYQHDAPCAVCQSVSRTSAIMLPGSDVCPKGWYLEYQGLLMSGNCEHKAPSQYICVDYATESLDGGLANENGKLFYAVKTRCGTLRCPPYVNDQFITCAVCTR